MTCSALDLTGCFGMAWAHLLGMLPWYLPWIGWGIVALVTLWVLSQIKNVAGYPGVIGVLGIVAYLVGYFRGSRHDGLVPHEHVDAASPDALPSASVSPSARPRAAGVTPSAVRPPDDLPPKSLTER